MVAAYDARQTPARPAPGRLALARLADRLAEAAGTPAFLPSLFLFTDPARTPNPVADVRGLPPGCGVVFRHFGAPGRERTAAALRAACDAGGHALLIAADPDLARETGADGVHWPGWARPKMLRTKLQHFSINSVSAHGLREAVSGAAAGADIVFLSPVFASDSPSAGRPLGLLRAASIARAASAPVYALGGVGAANAASLIGTGLAGIASVSALSPPQTPVSDLISGG